MAEIKEEDIFYGGIVDEEKALACLLNAGLCFLNHAKGPDGDKTTCIYVACNDVFAWGCADAEPILNNDWREPSEIIDLYRIWKKNDRWASTQWVCLKRGEQPQAPVKKMMIEQSAWNEELEKLTPNRYDALCRDHAEDRKRKENDN